MHSIYSSHVRLPKHLLIKSPSFFFHLLHLSSTPPSTDLQPHFMVDYLIDSLKLSNPEAISVSTKVRHLKSPQNPQSVINFLRNYNLSDSEIKSIVLSHPNILLRNVDKTLAPKFRVLTDLGFSSQDLANVIKRDHNLLVRSLHTSIVPTINLLMNILGSKEKIVRAIKKSHWPFYGRFFRINVMLLERYGVSNKDIGRVILRNPRLVTQSPVRLESKLVEVEQEFGIKPSSRMFSYGLSALCSLTGKNLRRKFEVFKGFGWCDSDIFTIVNSQPLCLTHSEERLRKGLSFFMNELGYAPSWLAARGCLLMYSLEKRIKPRYRVYVVLKEKGLMTRELHSLMCLSDADFVKNVVERYREEMPDHLYDSSTKIING
ncbi:hypothetical protein L1987_51196 [Smallanthus sonchifolius]|uniref:Uncharacterized protein n=1 Tax=Smallanthus sonchifolius TaxID=185202 RepID=A0ACB9EQS3_9ASTR|nr:hypothetical protein L1987_51196 [Smallanthus sonchifolius]